MSEENSRVLYMIGNAHIDPVWLWQWQEGLQEVRATFRSAVELMEEYDDFIFTCDSVAYLDWVERVDPELWESIRHRVAEGRFVVVGGWWIEPDCNLPHGESLVRQALYAQRFLYQRFGRVATVGCNVDPFGHAATLPQLLSKAGINAYTFLRPQPKEKALPGEVFWWSTPDGSRVLAYRIPYAYCSPGEAIGPFLEHVLERAPASDQELMIFYGVGNHGGGPTRANLDSIERLDSSDNGLRLRLSGPRAYFDAMTARDDLPTYVGDLQHHAVGCYSAHSGVKRWNRRAEHMLMAAERWSTVAAALGTAPYPSAELERAWKLVLFNQFHDTLAGTAIAPAYEDARDQYGYAATAAADALNLAVQSVTRGIAIPAEAGTYPFVVINTLPWPVAADVEFELANVDIGTDDGAPVEVAAVDEESGAAVGVQPTTSFATVGGPHRRLVLATDLPPLGYRLYRVRPTRLQPGAAGAPHVTEAQAGPGTEIGAQIGAETGAETGAGAEGVLENPYLRVGIDPGTGWLSSLWDKELGAELVPAGGGGHAVVLDDSSDTWSHDLVSYEGEVGRFACTSVRVVERGPVRSVIEVASAYGASRLIERFVLGARARHLEVRVQLDWHERHRVLKLRFPCAVEQPTATFSVPYGRLERPHEGSEEVGQAWVDVSGHLPYGGQAGGGQAGGGQAGWAVLNDGKYAYDVQGSEIGMTAARSPVYAWHNPKKLGPGERYDYLDQGRQDFAYALVPHGGDPDRARVPRLAEELNERPVAFPEHFHPGTLPPAQGFASDGGGAVMLSALKRAEDSSAVVVRAYETTGAESAARIEIPLLGRTIEATFAPGEVKTFLVPEHSERPVEEVSLLEWPLEMLSRLA